MRNYSDFNFSASRSRFDLSLVTKIDRDYFKKCYLPVIVITNDDSFARREFVLKRYV